MESNENDTKELIHKTERFKTKLMVTKGEMGVRMDWEVGISIYTLWGIVLYSKFIK